MRRILEAVRGSERKPGKIRGKIQNRAREVLPFALQEFDAETAEFFAENDVERSVLYPAGSTDSCRGSRGGKYYKENQK